VIDEVMDVGATVIILDHKLRRLLPYGDASLRPGTRMT
jgi:hypothetical protein